MTRQAFFLLILAFLCMGADDTGCQSEASSDVNQDRIHSTYWVLYDVESDTTFARAQFRFGNALGTTLELTDGATATYDGKPMGFNATLDWHEVVLAGRVESGVFTYTDVEGRVFENPVPPFDEASVPASLPAVLASDEAFTLAWDGTPLVQGELMEVLVASAANGFDFVRIDQATPGSTDVVLGAGTLAQIAKGPALIQLRRHHDYPLEQGPSDSGKVTTTYQSVRASFDLQ